MMDGYESMMDGSGGTWVLLAVLVATAVILAFAGGWAAARRSVTAHGNPDHAVALLRRRLALGEIDDDEYLRRRSVIDSD